MHAIDGVRTLDLRCVGHEKYDNLSTFDLADWASAALDFMNWKYYIEM